MSFHKHGAISYAICMNAIHSMDLQLSAICNCAIPVDSIYMIFSLYKTRNRLRVANESGKGMKVKVVIFTAWTCNYHIYATVQPQFLTPVDSIHMIFSL